MTAGQPPEIPTANGVECIDCPGFGNYYEGVSTLECPEVPYDPYVEEDEDPGHEGVSAVYITSTPLGRPDDDDHRIPGQDRWVYPASFDGPTP